MLKGMIVKNISNLYTVKVNDEIYECQARGKFRKEGLTPLVGDEVIFDEENHYILEILKRKNELKRPSVSNIDVALIITSVKKPDLSLYLLDKQITSIVLENITPVICFTKLDLLEQEELKGIEELKTYYQNLGYSVFYHTQLSQLVACLQGKKVVLTGQTGAGKSTLLNQLDPDLSLKTGEISEALGRGRHTTRHTEFFMVQHVFIADTPGFSALDLTSYSKEDIRDAFVEFQKYPCEFKNCMHIKEQNCEVKKKVEEEHILKSRYENYCHFVK